MAVESRPPDEAALISRSRQGDAQAYARLVADHQELAFRTAYAITRNAADAEDAAQEGFVKAYRALGRFHDGSPFRPWLLAIVANEARNRRSWSTSAAPSFWQPSIAWRTITVRSSFSATCLSFRKWRRRPRSDAAWAP